MPAAGSASTSSARPCRMRTWSAYYRTVLKQKGDELFEAPPTHQFETARFRDEIDGVRAERDDQGLHLRRLGGLSESEAGSDARTVSDHHPDRRGSPLAAVAPFPRVPRCPIMGAHEIPSRLVVVAPRRAVLAVRRPTPSSVAASWPKAPKSCCSRRYRRHCCCRPGRSRST